MKSIVKILLVAFIFSVNSCSPKGDGSVTEVNVNGNMMYAFSLNSLKSDTTTIPLSSLVENCTIVQLETLDEAYFNPWFTTVTDKYIGVRQQGGRPYKLFDRAGKFLCNVGAVGQGPGEYSISPYDDIIDDKSGMIYLANFNSDKIFVYDISGKFIKNIDAPYRLNKPKLFLSDNILTVVQLAFSSEEGIAIQFDINTGKVLKECLPPAHFIMQSYDSEIFNTRNALGIFDFFNTMSDTLYHFDVKDNIIQPFFMMTYDASEKPFRQNFHLNKDLLLTRVSFPETDPNTGRRALVFRGLVASDLKNKTSSYIKVVNDFYGNLPTVPSVVTFRNGYFVHNIQPEQLMEEIEKRLAEKSCTEDDKQILRKILSTLKENDNNVVIIGKLKSEVQTQLF